MIEFRTLEAEDVECRVKQCSENGVSILLYKDARCDMRILDETVGPENWQCRYAQIDGKLFCDVGLRFKDGEWVWKQDVGVPSNMESTKGEASDAFKRACFKWGIGRELYTAPRIWVGADKCTVREGRNGKKQCYDDFRVTEMAVNAGQIVKLVIRNMSRKGIVVYGAPTSEKTPKQRLWAAISHDAELRGISTDDVIAELKESGEWADTDEAYNAMAEKLEAKHG